MSKGRQVQYIILAAHRLPISCSSLVSHCLPLCSESLDDPIELQGEDRGLRQRRVHYPEELRHSSDEEDGEEVEFKLPDRREEKPGLSIIHLIIGALALLCLGSFFFSGEL